MDKVKILLITTDTQLINSFSQQVISTGNELRTVSEGTDALAKTKLDKPSLVFVDMTTPDTGGPNFVQKMKSDTSLKAVPIIGVFADTGQDSEVDQLKNMGMDDFIKMEQIKNDAISQKILEMTKSFATPIAESSGAQSSPADAAQLESVSPPSLEKTPVKSASKIYIMLVEDDPFLNRIMSSQLQEDSKFEVINCIDAETALQKLETEQRPNLILLDLLLPGMNGLEFLEKIKGINKWKDIPVIILSNFGQEEYINKAQELGAEEFLVKAHYVPEEIINKIREILESPKK